MAIPEISSQNSILDRKQASSLLNQTFSSNLRVKTREGDLVHLNFENRQFSAQSRSETQLENDIVVGEFSSVALAASRYSLTVEGDLNEDELKAIQQLVRRTTPIARTFFSKAEFDAENAAHRLQGNPEILEEVEVSLKREIQASLNIEIFTQDESGAENPSEELETAFRPLEETEIDASNIRDLPSLTQAAVQSEFETQVRELSRTPTILKSLTDLMRFLENRFSEFFHPLNHPEKPLGDPLPPEPRLDGVTNSEGD